MGASIRAKMKDKILLILKIVGIIVSEKPLGLYVDVDGHRMSVLVKGQRKVFQF